MHRDAEFWDRAAEKYARDPIKDMASYEHTLGRTISYFSPHASVLEVGCGTGSTALLMAPSAGKILATDISRSMIAIARDKLQQPDAPQNVTFEVAELTDAGLPAGPFDVVTAFNLLHLVPDIDAALDVIARRVRPGGLFISKTICMADSALTLLRPVIGFMKLFGLAPGHVHFLSQERLRQQIVAHGFQIVESGNFPKKPPRHFVVARRMD